MRFEIGHGNPGVPDKTGPGEVKVLLLERDGPTLAAVKVALENLGVGVISAQSAARAVNLCSSPHFRFDVLVLGPSVLDPGLGSLLGRVLSSQTVLRVLVLTAGNLGPAGSSTMTPLAVCWALERTGCEYSLLDDPWTRPRLHRCLQELLERAYEPAAHGYVTKGAVDGPIPGGNQCPTWLRTRVKL